MLGYIRLLLDILRNRMCNIDNLMFLHNCKSLPKYKYHKSKMMVEKMEEKTDYI
jgi:hypothetical protein